MKKTITIFVFILCAITAKSQEKCHTLDSMIFYEYRILDDGFDSVPYSKNLYSYDSNGNTISEVTYYYEKFTEELQHSWKESDSIVRSYDSVNNQILQLRYYWDYSSNDWLSFLKYEYKYDNRNNLIYYQTSYWDYTINKWYLEEKKEYEFDENNNRISYEIYRNVDTVGQQPVWNLYEKEENLYNEGNKIIEHIKFRYESDSAALVNFKKRVYEYNEKGTLISEKEYNWFQKSSEWKEYFTNFYDSSGKLIQRFKSNYKIEYEYDAAGNLIFQTYYEFNTDSDEWLKNSYYVLKYNHYNNLLSQELFVSNTETGNFNTSEKWEYGYDFAGQLIYKGLYLAYPFFNSPSINKYEGYFYYFSYNSEIIEEKETICPGDSIFWQGGYYKNPGTYHSINNCDSIYLLDLDITENPEVLEILGDTSVNAGINFIYTVSYDSTLEYNWIVENGYILSQPTDSTVEITWENPGGGSVLLLTTSEFGCTSDTSTLKVDIIVNSNMSLMDNQIHVFPNPTKSSFALRFPDQFVDNGYTINIINNLGVVVYTSAITDNEMALEIPGILKSGIYIINLFDDNKNIENSIKLLVQ